MSPRAARQRSREGVRTLEDVLEIEVVVLVLLFCKGGLVRHFLSPRIQIDTVTRELSESGERGL